MLVGKVIVRAEDASGITIRRINHILEALGVSPLASVSTRIFAKPQTVHVIHPQDLRFLSTHAQLLTTATEVQCDFGALSLILWGKLRALETALDRLHQEGGEDHPDGRGTSQLEDPSLSACLIEGFFIINILRAFEAPAARREIRESTKLAAEDTDMTIRLATKIASVMSAQVPLITAHYRKESHRTIRLMESLLCSTWLLLGDLVQRSEANISSIVALLNARPQWTVSGFSHRGTEAYCKALQQVVVEVFYRQEEFSSKDADDIAVQLLFHRMANRPPFDWDLSSLFIYQESEWATRKRDPYAPCVDLLVVAKKIQSFVESCLASGTKDPSSSSSAGKSRNGSRGIRRALSQHLATLESDKSITRTPLSYFQLMCLSALRGMPLVDMTDDAALVDRAKRTHLTTHAEILHPDYLRLLLACSYTVKTPANEPLMAHALLSHASVIALYRSFAKYIIQEKVAYPLPAERGSSVVCPFVLHSALKLHLFIELFIRHVAADNADADHNGNDSESRLSQELVSLVAQTIHRVYAANDALYTEMMNARNGVADAMSTLFTNVSPIFRAVTSLAASLLFFLLESPEMLNCQTNLRVTLDSMARVYALSATSPLPPKATAADRKRAQQLLMRMKRRLALVPQRMKTRDIENVLTGDIAVMGSAATVAASNRLRLALLEGYLQALSSSSVAYAISDDVMLKYWVDIAIPAITNSASPSLAVTGHDFLVAPLIAQKAISPLFVPTYVAVMVPDGRYGEPPMVLVKRFATMVRTSCQGLEQVDSTRLEAMLEDPQSVVCKMVASSPHREALQKITPTSAMLLIVSSIFDKLCVLWKSTPGFVSDAQSRFVTYFSALVNLLQCTNTQVLYRVCASIEAVEVEHMRGAGKLQMETLKYIEAVVDNVKGNSKKGVTEWFLKLSEKIKKEATVQGSKL